MNIRVTQINFARITAVAQVLDQGGRIVVVAPTQIVLALRKSLPTLVSLPYVHDDTVLNLLVFLKLHPHTVEDDLLEHFVLTFEEQIDNLNVVMEAGPELLQNFLVHIVALDVQCVDSVVPLNQFVDILVFRDIIVRQGYML